jgi:hydroxyethylthiazole kinase-like uncharacterized protein yjeF
MTITALDDDALRAWPLPQPDRDGDKAARGRTLIVGGSAELPGAVILAAVSALRAGAGKVMVATAAGVAQAVAVAVPEARVLALPETGGGGFHLKGVAMLVEVADQVDALLVGPGMQEETSACRFVEALLPLFPDAACILDAMAMCVVGSSAPFERPPLLTPHAGEMAHLTGQPREEIERDGAGTALAAARRWNAVLALKGAVTHIASPEGRLWRSDAGNVGLATSGSGDVLAGLLVGLAARGAPLPQAAAWGVALHARAGVRLAQRLGTLGYLARELPAEVPGLMQQLGAAAG